MIEVTIKQHWQQTPMEEGFLMTVAQLQLRSVRFQNHARRGDFVESFGCALVVAIFASFLWVFPDLMTRIGALSMIFATAFAGYQLRKHRAASLPSVDEIASSLLDFHRTELLRRKRLLVGSGRLVIGPLLLGLLIFTVCLSVRDPPHAAAPFTLCGLTAIFGIVMAVYNRRQAQRLQHYIDECNAVSSNSNPTGKAR